MGTAAAGCVGAPQALSHGKEEAPSLYLLGRTGKEGVHMNRWLVMNLSAVRCNAVSGGRLQPRDTCTTGRAGWLVPRQLSGVKKGEVQMQVFLFSSSSSSSSSLSAGDPSQKGVLQRLEEVLYLSKVVKDGVD